MCAQVLRVRRGKLFEGYELPRLWSQVEQSAPKCELVGRHVAPKQDYPAPVVLRAMAISKEGMWHCDWFPLLGMIWVWKG